MERIPLVSESKFSLKSNDFNWNRLGQLTDTTPYKNIIHFNDKRIHRYDLSRYTVENNFGHFTKFLEKILLENRELNSSNFLF